jgi:hypothetical protein
VLAAIWLVEDVHLELSFAQKSGARPASSANWDARGQYLAMAGTPNV